MDNKKGILNIFNKSVEIFLAVILLLITIFTFYQVALRYVFNKAPYWSEELVRFLFVWSSFIAAAIGIKEKAHLGIDSLVALFPEKLRKITEIFSYIVVSFFGVIILYYGIPVVKMTHSQPSPALSIPMSYVYVALPLAGALIVLYSIIEIFKIVKELRRN